MKKTLNTLSIIFMLIALISVGSFSALATDPTEPATWSYDAETKLLTVLSNEAMQSAVAPWYKHCSKIEAVEFGAGVTTIGRAAFSGCTALETITIPTEITFIDAYAFRNSAITTIIYCGEEYEWNAIAKDFYWDNGMNEHTVILHHWTELDEELHKFSCDFCDAEDATAAHEWYVEEYIVSPTHTESGEAIYRCFGCGATKEGAVSAIPHQYELYEIVAPTCSATGRERYRCECGASYSLLIPIDENAHSFQAVGIQDATKHKSACKYCDEEFEEAHIWNEGEIVIAPTCSSTGLKKFTCNACNETKEEVMDLNPLNHEGLSEEFVEYNGIYHYQECACGSRVYKEHILNEGEITLYPSHTANGEKTFTCQDCSYVKVESIPRLTDTHTPGDIVEVDGNDSYHAIKCAECGEEYAYEAHSYDDGVITPNTHDQEGKKTYSCACGYQKVEKIAPGHAFFGEWVNHNETHHKKVCTGGDNCSEAIYAEHTWDEGVLTLAPTHTVAGEKTFTCADCGATRVEYLDMIPDHIWEYTYIDEVQHSKECECGAGNAIENHNWEIEYKAPTHTEDGYEIQRCKDCLAEIILATYEKTPTHTFGGECIYQDEFTHIANCECGEATALVTHTWDSGVIIVPATHSNSGTITYTCTGCGATKTEQIPTNAEHNYSNCVNIDANQHALVCDCGVTLIYTPHTWDKGTVVDGMMKYVCSGCNAEKTEALPPETPAEANSGCGSVLSVGSGLVFLATFGAAGVMLKKKKKHF